MFKLTKLHALYQERLAVLGIEKTVNKSRLKDQLLAHFDEDCQEQTVLNSTFLVFNEGLQEILKSTVAARDFDEEALSMNRVVKAVRQEIFGKEFFNFAGSFPADCQGDSVPAILKSLVSLLLYGSSINDHSAMPTQACLTICQLVLFNSKQRAPERAMTRHTKVREPPFPLYMGLYIHTHTRSKKMMTHLYELGLSISYERLLEILDWFTAALCQRFEQENSVCPAQLREGIFTVGVIDNIDHNLSSTTAEGSFHGTGLSLLQFPTADNPGESRPPIRIPPENTVTPPLPDSYSIVPDVVCNVQDIKVPGIAIPDTVSYLEIARRQEIKWLQQSIELLSKDTLGRGEHIAWAAYHASDQPNPTDPSGISALLPLFFEKAATISMIKHGMTIVKRETERLNSGQIPVLAADQPLFTLCKYVQWTWPETYGETSYVIMFGGLHLEMALWNVLGDLLKNSGWTTALTEAEVASAGTADSFLRVAHLTRTRHAHQVTALTLAKLQHDARQTMQDDESDNQQEDEAFTTWKSDMSTKSPTFAFWDLVLQLEMLVLIFVRAHRERNFALYIDVLETLTPWFFVFDRQNYARWVPVHLRDMKTIPEGIEEQLKRFWVFPKGQRRFCAMPLDQAHEQNNANIKDSGGAIGLTENPKALKRWMVGGPEQARLLTEFEKQYSGDDPEDFKSHEEGFSTQQTFKKQVNKLCATITTMGNPFIEESKELMSLCSHDCVDQAVVGTFRNMEHLGKEQYEEYVTNVLVERNRSIHQPIKRNNIMIFKQPTARNKSKMKQQLEDIKSDYSLFSQLYISCQVRGDDNDEFFMHENHPWPPSLSDHGKLRLPTCKSQLLDLLNCAKPEVPPNFDCKVFDGPAVVHSLPREDASTFGQYSEVIFRRWTIRQLQNCQRIDVVWDAYRYDSLKEATREKRGKGVRKKVSSQTKLPKDFGAFLQDSQNKEELFALLTEDVAATDYPPDKVVHITAGQSVVTKGDSDQMPVSDQEEADTRMCLHVADAAKKGARVIMVSTVDTDVVVILIGIYFQLVKMYITLQLWVAFGKGKNFRYFHINSICSELGEDRSCALPFFHAFTGSDTTSQFLGKAKKSCWECWRSCPSVTEAFMYPNVHPYEPMSAISPQFELIEKFICKLYDRSSGSSSVNDLRRDLFPRKTPMMQNLPPTQAALIEHTNRSVYQASIWLQCLEAEQKLPSPVRFGWAKQNNQWQPVWTTQPEVSKTCRQLIKCGCKADPVCTRKCVCKSTGLKCTALCYCRGLCTD